MQSRPIVPLSRIHRAASRMFHTSPPHPTEDQFRYIPFHPPTQPALGKRIRLIELLPGLSSQPIRCYLRDYDLDDTGSYEALSYCWGDSHQLRNITCNGRSLPISRNLEQGLRDLRWTDRSRLLWADAVCINQSDPAEKATQVPLMKSIYSRAQRTVIWLGTPRDDHDRPISATVKFGIKFGLAALARQAEARRAPAISQRDAGTGKKSDLMPFSADFYLTLMSILRRPWFQRAWIVQEVAVSPKATLLWDGREYEWDNFISVLRYMPTVRFPLAFMPTFQHVAAIDHERARFRNGRNSLQGTLMRNQRTAATDLRDKAFSFYGLVGSGMSEAVPPVSYTSDTASIYQELATRILEQTKSLDLLSLPPSLDKRNFPHLPSWVPDWSVRTGVDLCYTWDYGPLSLAGAEVRDAGDQTSRFSAARDTMHSPELSRASNQLIVRGTLLDTVEEVGPAFEGIVLPTGTESIRRFAKGWAATLRTYLKGRDAILAWLQLAAARSGTVYEPTGEPVLEAFWQTVCAGEYTASASAHRAAQLWNRATRFSLWKLGSMPSLLDPLSYVFCVYVLLRYSVINKPMLEFELQSRYTLNRRMVRTTRGYLGLAGGRTAAGDSVFLCRGSTVPLVMRKAEPGASDEWRFVGDAYVHGAMHGEAFEAEKCARLVII